MRINVLFAAPKDLSKLFDIPYGGQFYLESIIKALNELGYSIRTVSFDDREFVKYLKTSEYVHYYLAPLKILAYHNTVRRDASNPLAIYHAHFIDDHSTPIVQQLRWRAYLPLSALFVDRYLVSSEHIAQKLIQMGIPRKKVYKVLPYYSCSCKALEDEELLRRKSNLMQDVDITITYLGRYHPWRFPFKEVIKNIKTLMLHYSKRPKVTFYILFPSKGSNRIKTLYNSDEIHVILMQKNLTSAEKCELMRKSHFILLLHRKNVTMEPPLTLIEAIYHNAIPLLSKVVYERIKFDAEIPVELVVKNLHSLSKVLYSIMGTSDYAEIMLKLRKASIQFFDKNRFLNELENVHE